MAGHDVPAEAAVGGHGPLQVHPAARAEVGQGGAVQGFVHHVGGKGRGGEGGGGEAHAVHGDAVAQVNVLQDHLGLDLQHGAVAALADALDGSHLFHNAGKHQASTSLSMSRSCPSQVRVGAFRRIAWSGWGKPCPPTGDLAVSPPRSLGAM